MAPVILSVKEKEGLTAILKKLNTDDLVSLTYTASHGMVKAETRDEAIRIVLTFTDKPSVLLRRRKVKKELIFQYLREEGVVVSVNGEKMDFVKACLQYWKSSEANKDMNQASLEEYPDEPSGVTAVPHEDAAATSVTKELSPLQEMGHQFVLWFFRLFNNCTADAAGPDGFGPQHFWQDCTLKVCAEQNGQAVMVDSVCGSDNVSAYLYKLVAAHRLFFNPNMNEEGIMCEQEYHGLVGVSVGGVLHQGGNCVGLFDMAFGLVLDPNSTCRWRIKYTKLLLKLSRAAATAGHPLQLT